MSDASTAHQAESLRDGYDSLKAFTDATRNSVSGSSSGGNTAGGGTGSANAFGEPLMLFGSPSGIALSTQQSVHIASNAQTNLVSGQSTHIATGKSLIASVAEKLSLFVQNGGMKLFAAKGKVEVQAHSDNIEITAQKTLKILSSTERIEIASATGILLTSGGGYIRLKDGNIEIHSPGVVDIKGAAHMFAGPAQMRTNLGAFKQSDGPYDEKFVFKDELGRPMPSMAHLLEMRSDQLENVTDQDGAVSRMFTSNPEKISAFLHFPNITSGTDSLS
ncbi:UNVERIFIED_ORG: uncharacterized protein (DUF2345 family) [Burkholderia sp. 1595]|uniref:Uncharacterized protein (DUF2345 family) n=2 Tax=Paraburkholderia terricola TaxID=169427 RepID=A0ABU1M0P4_9BURK|nr:uncharacterized protein (DUF2345 family) [Paraburkholderia terricola]MDR6485002.1 uncharacterized protein (DUF2345 family) [Paraburkholderia terricola]